MTIYTELKAIKNAKALAALAVKWEAMHRAAAPNSAAPNWAKDRASDNFKEGGVAYWRDVCLSHANGIMEAASREHHFLEPSKETLDWGGFMGGEYVSWTDARRWDDAEQKLVAEIRAA